MTSFCFGIISCWLIDNKLELKLFLFFKSSTVILFFFAIDHSVSPGLTTYISSFNSAGTFNWSPTFIVVVNKSLISISSWTDILYSLEIDHKLSPFFTVYIVYISSPGSSVIGGDVGGKIGLGNFSSWPIYIVLPWILFSCFILFGVVLNAVAIEYKVSPFFTMYVFGVVCSDFRNNFWPTSMVSVTRLLISFNAWTVML